MKRVFIFSLIVMIMCPIFARAASFVDALSDYYDGVISYAEIEDKLIIIGEYDRMVNAGNSETEDIYAKYSEELKKYTSIVLLLEKDGIIYLGVVIPLTNGIDTDETKFLLMSPMFLQENIVIGQ